MKCPRCQGAMTVVSEVMDCAPYEFHRCVKCGEEVLDMRQLKALGAQHRKLRSAKEVRFSSWGNSIAVRIPKEVADSFKITDGTIGLLTKEKDGIKIIPT